MIERFWWLPGIQPGPTLPNTHTPIRNKSILSLLLVPLALLLLRQTGRKHLTASLGVLVAEKTVIAERQDFSTTVLLIKHRTSLYSIAFVI